jgi:hypothetical protein
MSAYDKIVRRPAERKCYCRGCDIAINKGEEMVYTYTHRNRGQSIIFCLNCAVLIGDLGHGVENDQMQ